MVSKTITSPVLRRVLIFCLVLCCSHQRLAANMLQPENNTSTQDHEVMLQISSDYNKLMFFSLIVTIGLALVVVFLLMSRNRRDKQMEAYITETRIAKKVHDEIANELYGTLNYLTTEENLTADSRQKLIAKLDDIYLMTRNISRETNNIDTGYHFPDDLRMMLSSYGGSNLNVIVTGLGDIDWNNTDILKKIAVFRSLQELMVNMKKHSEATLLTVSFAVNHKQAEIRYTDNGKGAAIERLASKNGLENIESRITAIGGSFALDTAPGKGFHITLTYPA